MDRTICINHRASKRPTCRTHGHDMALRSMAHGPQARCSGVGCHRGNHGLTVRGGRWRSERQAAEYATPPLDWELELLALLPWPPPDAGIIMRATTSMQTWPFAVMGDEASAIARQTAPIPIVVSHSTCDSGEGIFGPNFLG